MSDVFNTDTTFGKAIKGTAFTITAGGSGSGSVLGALVQDFSAQYQRQINRIYELGSRQQSYVEGPTAGQLQLSQVVGPGSVVDDLLAQLGDLCNAEQNSVTLAAGAVMCSGDQTKSFTFHNAVATGTSIAANVGNFIIQRSLSVIFTSMDV